MNRELNAFQTEIENLKIEISELKKNVAKKEKELKEIHNKEAEDLNSVKALTDENIDLKAVVENLRKVNAISLKEKDEEIETLKLRNRVFQEKQNDVIKAKNDEIAKLKFDLACTKCDYKAETMNSLITHVIRKHDTREDLTIICDDCDYKCLKDFDLQLHKSAKHPGNLIAFKGFTKMKPTKTNFLYARTNEFK